MDDRDRRLIPGTSPCVLVMEEEWREEEIGGELETCFATKFRGKTRGVGQKSLISCIH